MKTSVRNGRPACRARLVAFAATLSLFSLATAVWAQDQFCIPPHEGLPFHGGLPPTIDGYVGRVDGISLATDPVEQGWVRSGLFTYGGGGTTPWMELRGIKHNADDVLYLSFVVHSDVAFHSDDAIVVVLDAGWAQGLNYFTANARRIDIRPIQDVSGPPGGPGTGPFDIRTNRVPVTIDWKKYQAASGWTNLASPPLAPQAYDIKVRSWSAGPSDNGWSVELKLPTTIAKAGTNEWFNLGTSFGFYANVLNFCGSASCQSPPVLWTGIDTQTSYQFTWPRTNSTMPTTFPPNDCIVTPSDCFRAITGLFPDVPSALNAVQAQWLGKVTIGPATGACKGVRFANGPSGIGVLGNAGTLGTTIDATGAASNTLVARVLNDGTANDGLGVSAEFRIANWGVGGGPGTWDRVPNRPIGNLPSGPLNEFTPNSNPSFAVDVPSGGPGDVWMRTQVLPADGYCNQAAHPSVPCPAGSKDAHTCVWVLLESNRNAYISESSVRRNFDIVGLSSLWRPAEISAKGWGTAAGRGKLQEFYLTTHRRYLVHPGRAGNMAEVPMPRGVRASPLMAPDEKHPVELFSPLELDLLKNPALGRDPLWNFVWMVNASRATTNTLLIAKTTYRLYEPAGSFGTVGQHWGAVDRFVDELRPGKSLRRVTKDGTYRATIPDGGAIRVQTLVGALGPGEKIPKEPESRPVPAPSPGR